MSRDPAKRLLIVEDSEDIAFTMAELLQGEGYEVACATSGRQAVQYLQAAQTLPHLILLDVMMPDMDGFEFRAEQALDPRLSDIPVLLMTAGADIRTTAAELGARGYLKKPFKDLGTILDAIERCL